MKVINSVDSMDQPRVSLWSDEMGMKKAARLD